METDYDFWIGLEDLPLESYNGGRKIQTLITRRILNRTRQYSEKHTLLGLGRSRLANGNLMMERDFVVQTYTMGLMGGLLFVAPYIAAMLYCGIQLLRSARTRFRIELLAIFAALGMFFCAALYSGHLIDELYSIILGVFYLGFLIDALREPAPVQDQEGRQHA